MSWLNSSLSTLKGQLTNLAQEVLAETAGPGDLEYEGHGQDTEQQTKTALQLLAETQEQKEQLDRQCEQKDREIAALRREVAKCKQESRPAASTSAPKETQLAGIWDICIVPCYGLSYPGRGQAGQDRKGLVWWLDLGAYKSLVHLLAAIHSVPCDRAT
ncbi:hypothetical protein M5D96_012140 [Drosophila gunungcola]|uniref:Uncharacterized protein n=1 Tax=Drosophila gunungcola TaxID=103775 RepID=A0A9Q0BK21_9MUSC|nr:hypothetical protein M5D96_012140 [Drosophila gunungcola]